MTAVAACENPATSLQPASPLVTCRTTAVTVKLPHGTSLKRVKALGEEGVVGRALTTKIPGGVLVEISTAADAVRKIHHDPVCKRLGSEIITECFAGFHL